MKSNGFSLIEVLVATGVFFMSIIVFVPIITQLTTEQTILKDRLQIAYDLHDELQSFIWTNASLPSIYKKNINEQTVQYTFITQEHYIKGCAIWENARKAKENICLEALPNK